MEFRGKTIQEHIWKSMEEIMEKPYSVWDWVVLFEHYKIPIKNDINYWKWVDKLKDEGRILR